eukprot:scaffold27684_cov17-Tisochrysis_lutea.AAC.2
MTATHEHFRSNLQAIKAEQDELTQSLQMLLRIEQLLEGGPDVKLEEAPEMGLAVDMPAPPPNLSRCVGSGEHCNVLAACFAAIGLMWQKDFASGTKPGAMS